MECADRRDLILLFAAGDLDAAEADEVRRHLAGGCPQCAGYLAEAEAALAMLPLTLKAQRVPAALRQTILDRARGDSTGRESSEREPLGRESSPMRIGGWDRVVLPGAIAAVLAVAITLLVVKQFWPVNVRSAEDQKTIADLRSQLLLAQAQTDGMAGQLQSMQAKLSDAQKSLQGMKFAELTGPAQPAAVGHVFLDTTMKNWYFFTCGMKPAPDGKTYELWLISDGQKIPAGTFEVNERGTATLLGSIPPLSGNAKVVLAVTDEPSNGPHQVPTGSLQIKGSVE